jgi:hypothetical protein
MDWHLSSRSRIVEFDPNQPRIPKGSPGGGRWAKVQAIFDSVTTSSNPNAYGRMVSSVKAMLNNDRLRQATYITIPEDPDFYENLSRDEVTQLDLMLTKHGKANPIDMDRVLVPTELDGMDLTDDQRLRASKYTGVKGLTVLRTARDLPTGTVVFSWRSGRSTSRVGISPDGSLYSYWRGSGWEKLEDGPPDDPMLRDDRSTGDRLRSMFGEPAYEKPRPPRFPPATQKSVDEIVAHAQANGMEIDDNGQMIDIIVPSDNWRLTSAVTYYIQKVGKRTLVRKYVPETGEDDVISLKDLRREIGLD